MAAPPVTVKETDAVPVAQSILDTVKSISVGLFNGLKTMAGRVETQPLASRICGEYVPAEIPLKTVLFRMKPDPMLYSYGPTPPLTPEKVIWPPLSFKQVGVWVALAFPKIVEGVPMVLLTAGVVQEKVSC